MKKAFLALADGTVFEGQSCGAEGEVLGELVFNTSVAGYQEIITDPSSVGQLVVMTYPLIGNYGFISGMDESKNAVAGGLILKEIAKHPGNFRCEGTFEEYLKEKNVVAICGIDTRALTRIIREKGAINGVISTHEHFNFSKIQTKLQGYVPENTLSQVTLSQPYTIGTGQKKVAVLDLGGKKSILTSIAAKGYSVSVYPATVKKEEILKEKPLGVFLTSGPENLKEYQTQIQTIKDLMAEKVPLFGFGLGHQLMALAMGGAVEKMEVGHRGTNQPVKCLKTGKIHTTNQNHGSVVTRGSVEKIGATLIYQNVNDKTVEGLAYPEQNSTSVQFYPELDCEFLLDEFLAKLEVK